MKILLCALLFTSVNVFAKSRSQMKMEKLFDNSKIQKLINEGDFEVGGTVGFNNNDFGTNSNISTELQYFFLDNISIGGSFNVSTVSARVGGSSSSATTTSFGPSGSYYFWENNRLAAFGGQSLLLLSGLYDKTIFIGESQIGAKYFLTKNVALVGTFGLAYALNESRLGTSTGLDGAFSIHF